MMRPTSAFSPQMPCPSSPLPAPSRLRGTVRWPMADPDIRLEALTHLDRPTFAAIRSLLPQLKNSTLEATYSPSFEELAEVVESSGTTLIVARAGEVLVGMLTLVMVRLPSA